MKRAILLWLAAVGLVLPGICHAAPPRGWRIVYQRGFYHFIPERKMKADEEWSRQGGHMAWRRYPVYVASADAAEIVPLRVRMAVGQKSAVRMDTPRRVVRDSVEWTLAAQHHGKALVRVTISGRPLGEVRLLQPFGWWWYVASARRVRVPRSGIVLLHPDGTREYLPVRPLFIGRPAYIAAPDLERVGLGVKWDAARKAVEVYMPQSENAVWFRAGQRWVEGWHPRSDRARISWAPVRRGGRVFLEADYVARRFPTFAPMWNRRSGVLELHMKPMPYAGPRG